MSLRHLSLILAVCCAPLLAQDSAPPTVSTAELGFAYHIPAGWDVIDAQSTLPIVKQRQLEKAKTEEEKKEIQKEAENIILEQLFQQERDKK